MEALRKGLLPCRLLVSYEATFRLYRGWAMSQIVAVVEALKRALKARKLTYAHVARELKMSEASVKRM